MIDVLGRAAAGLALVMCLTPAAVAQLVGRGSQAALITGRVMDASSLTGLAGVEVRLLGVAASAVTNDSGAFRIVATASGPATIVMLRRLGYEPLGVTLDLRPGDSLHVATKLSPSASVLETVAVVGAANTASARLQGFERRRALGQGTFFTAEQLERTTSIRIADVLRTVPSLEVKGDDLNTIVSARGGARVGTVCRVRVLVDGHLMPLDMPLPVTSPKELRAIEVYAGPATMPLELVPFGEFASCGLIVVWTK
ncbi:MAG TPA: carboxypeptidase-like regulatory domain-containing protein [Gemmatimonadaceae bacterium]|nr:carboxypeptidase-like regulatory domain-containing protein [Gemmatimonadaceae bacterium]